MKWFVRLLEVVSISRFLVLKLRWFIVSYFVVFIGGRWLNIDGWFFGFVWLMILLVGLWYSSMCGGLFGSLCLIGLLLICIWLVGMICWLMCVGLLFIDMWLVMISFFILWWEFMFVFVSILWSFGVLLFGDSMCLFVGWLWLWCSIGVCMLLLFVELFVLKVGDVMYVNSLFWDVLFFIVFVVLFLVFDVLWWFWLFWLFLVVFLCLLVGLWLFLVVFFLCGVCVGGVLVVLVGCVFVFLVFCCLFLVFFDLVVVWCCVIRLCGLCCRLWWGCLLLFVVEVFCFGVLLVCVVCMVGVDDLILWIFVKIILKC